MILFFLLCCLNYKINCQEGNKRIRALIDEQIKLNDHMSLFTKARYDNKISKKKYIIATEAAIQKELSILVELENIYDRMNYSGCYR